MRKISMNLAPALIVLLALAGLSVARAADEAPPPAADPHAHHHHHAAAADQAVTRSVVEIALPDLKLVRDDGRSVKLVDEVDDGRPVLVTFIYTSCTTICPVITQTMAQFQDQLGAEAGHVHMMSISIDPEQDTPARLREYAQKYGAGPQWKHYTGTNDSSIAVQRAFGVYRGDKMNHAAVVFLRPAPGKPWVRMDGFVTPADLVGEYRTLVAKAN